MKPQAARTSQIPEKKSINLMRLSKEEIIVIKLRWTFRVFPLLQCSGYCRDLVDRAHGWKTMTNTGVLSKHLAGDFFNV